MATKVAVKANVFRRFGNRVGDYFKTLGNDYAEVGRGVLRETRDRPLKAGIVAAALGALGYSLKTNPSKAQFDDRLCSLRQNMAILPLSIHSSRAGL